MQVIPALTLLGGIASLKELYAAGCWPHYAVEMAHYYGKILRVRIGWYALLETPSPVLRAWRIGGRLACVSALQLHGQLEVAGPLHIVFPRGASRLRALEPSVMHWTRRPLPPGRGAVPDEMAIRQAASCAHLPDSGSSPCGPASRHPR